MNLNTIKNFAITGAVAVAFMFLVTRVPQGKKLIREAVGTT